MNQVIVDKIESYLLKQIELFKLFNKDSEITELLEMFKRREGVIADGMNQGQSRDYMERLTLKFIKIRINQIGNLLDVSILEEIDSEISDISQRINTQ